MIFIFEKTNTITIAFADYVSNVTRNSVQGFLLRLLGISTFLLKIRKAYNFDSITLHYTRLLCFK